MTLTLTGTTVAADAISGTTVGKFNVTGVRFQGHRLDDFLIVTQTGGDLLVTTWDGLATPGTVTVTVKAPGNSPTSFTLTILPAVTALPTPKSVNLSPASASVPDGSAAGLFLSTASITMSDGSAFAGQLTIQANPTVTLSGTKLVLSRALAPADDGTHALVVTATQTGGSASTSFSLTVTPTVSPPTTTVTVNGSSSAISVVPGAGIVATVASGPGNPKDWLGVYAVGSPSGPGNPASWKWLANDSIVVPAVGVIAGTVHLAVPSAAGQYEVRFFPNNGFTATAHSATLTVPTTATPTIGLTFVSTTPGPTGAPTIEDTAPAGAVVGTVKATMSDGSPFVGSLALSGAGAGLYAVSGTTIVTARALTPADDGTLNVSITATQGSAVATVRMI